MFRCAAEFRFMKVSRNENIVVVVGGAGGGGGGVGGSGGGEKRERSQNCNSLFLRIRKLHPRKLKVACSRSRTQLEVFL